MPLPIETERAIAEEKQKRALVDDHDFAELVAKTKGPPPEEKKEEKLKPEDIEKATDLLSKNLGFNRGRKKETDEKKDEKKAVGDLDDSRADKKSEQADEAESKTDDAAEASEDDKAKEEKPKKAKISKKPDIDPIEIASAAAARTAQAFVESHEASRAKAPAAGTDKAVEDALTEEERGELQVFQEMSKAGGDKDLPKKYLKYLKVAEDYQRNWEKEHPDQEFNPEASDHDAFYHKHQPKYSELEYKKAVARMAMRESSNQEVEKLTSEQKKLKAELAAREMEPVIRNTHIGAIAEIVKGIDENILKEIESNGFAKYAETHEIEADLINHISDRIKDFIAGVMLIDGDPEMRIQVDPKNPAHAEWARYLTEKEAELRKRPMRERLTEDGRVLVPRAEYFKMNEAARASHAFLDLPALLALRVSEEMEYAKTQYEKDLKKAETRAKALGWAPPSATKNGHTEEKKEEKKEVKTEETRTEKKSPEAGSASRIDTSAEGKSWASDDLMKNTASILFRRQ